MALPLVCTKDAGNPSSAPDSKLLSGSELLSSASVFRGERRKKDLRNRSCWAAYSNNQARATMTRREPMMSEPINQKISGANWVDRVPSGPADHF